ncbi:threonine--tRNA ligase [Candidatus Schneideria nysicola]|nr:threonine--tRNA ligase [Candidatus Schneideria nysicola]
MKILSSEEDTIQRDHRIIGKTLNLYHIQPESPGMIFWHNDGYIIFREIESFLREKLKSYNYQEVKSPFMMDKILWNQTGHWDNYSEHIFTTSSDNREYCIKPMNCPAHVLIFKQGIKSYRDLPLRIAEFGSCHRKEHSGALHGLMRIRGFHQDDAHIFCTRNQVIDEVKSCIKMVYDVYKIFGFKKISVNLSTRPKKRIGDDMMWDQGEHDLTCALEEENIPFYIKMGEGAFYGPKIEFTLFDYINRPWQCGTIQLDFSLPRRLNAFYIEINNTKAIPVMIHRAILGSIERFIGILTEEYAGFYPTWLAPTQVILMNITSQQSEYILRLANKMSNAGLRVKVDLRNEKIGFKIRESTIRRIPYMLICGNEEVETNSVTVRTYRGKNLLRVNYINFIDKIKYEVNNRSLYQWEE